MSTLFISDLHLSPDKPDLTQITVSFLQAQSSNIEALYILGDLFNTWIGDDIVPPEFEPLISQLQHLQQSGIKSYFMAGNRDFMVGKQFSQLVGCQLLDDSHIIDLYGTPTLLLHGDTLCIDDIAYQRYRRWSRNRLLQRCFLRLPGNCRQGISDRIKQQSQQQKRQKSAIIMDVNQAEVKRTMQKFKVAQLIHGHTHRPAIHELQLKGVKARRIVLGDWENEVSYLKVNANKCYQFVDPRIKFSGFLTMPV